jgi:AMMECR1 domain-containing protein
LSKNGRSAVFLPQVAPEQGWNLPETLSHLAEKAGLDKDAWQHGATFQTFQAVVFGEKEEHGKNVE